jgi:outer membrane protein TolC
MRLVGVPLHVFFFSVFWAGQALATDQHRFIEIVERMVAGSPEFQAAMSSAEADIVRARPGLYAHTPSVDASVSQGLQGTVDQKSDFWGRPALSLSVSMPVFNFGGDSTRVAGARLSQQGSEISTRIVRSKIENSMAALVINAIKLKKVAMVEENLFKSREALLNKAEGLYKRGLLPEEELEKNRVDTGIAKLQLAEIQLSTTNEYKTVEAAFGGSPGPLDWPWDLSFFSKFEKWNGRAWIGKNLDRALEEQFWERKKAENALALARAQTLPSFSFSSGLSKSLARHGETPLPATWSMQVSASLPIYSRFENSSRLEAALLQLGSANFRFEERKRNFLDLVLRTESSFRNKLTAARERTAFLGVAKKNLDRSRERFVAGRISSNELATDESRVLQMEQIRINLVADLHRDLLELCRVLTLSINECVSQIESDLQQK